MGRASSRRKRSGWLGLLLRRASRTLQPAAGVRGWPEGSLGGRFFGAKEVAQAPGMPAVGGLDLMSIAVDRRSG